MKKNSMQVSDKCLLDVQNVTMRFSRYANGILSLKELFIGLFTGKLKRDKIISLQDVSFQIHEGEAVAILGHNGAGKSTLLKIVSNILNPTKGHVICRAKIAPLLNLGAGFDPNATGLENLFINGAILGMSRKELIAKKDKIIEFSELGSFINDPVKSYSSGMVARLGFSIAIHYDADILIIDEVLSVGDVSFNNKCNAKMQELRKQGLTFLVVSHSESVKELCNRSLWLHHGRLMADGDTEAVFKLYNRYMKEEFKKNNSNVGGQLIDGKDKLQDKNFENIPNFLSVTQENISSLEEFSGVSFDRTDEQKKDS